MNEFPDSLFYWRMMRDPDGQDIACCYLASMSSVNSGNELLDCLHVECQLFDPPTSGIIEVIQRLLVGSFVILRGHRLCIFGLVRRVERILRWSNMRSDIRWAILCRLVVYYDDGAVQNVATDFATSEVEFALGAMELSRALIPALDYFGYSMGSRLGLTTAFDRGPEFLESYSCIPEALTGTQLEIAPHVFVPNTEVLDLAVAAYFDFGSPLKSDLQGATILEPCTGSGALALVLAGLGAWRVLASDIHLPSVVCASRNFVRGKVANTCGAILATRLGFVRQGSILFSNPPWHCCKRSWHTSDDAIRCLIDRNFVFTRRLLSAAGSDLALPGVAYLFFGSRTAPFIKHGEPHRHQFNPDDYGWTVTNIWNSETSPRLFRLERVVSASR